MGGPESSVVTVTSLKQLSGYLHPPVSAPSILEYQRDTSPLELGCPGTTHSGVGSDRVQGQKARARELRLSLIHI
eukprot:1240206-Rhodomonas_salina.4